MMYTFGRTASFPKFFLPVILAAAAVWIPSCSAFSDRDPRGPGPQAMQAWELQEFPMRAGWSERDLSVPLAIAGLPDEVPPSYVLPSLPAAGDQGRQASGTAWAVGYTAQTYLQRTKYGKRSYVCAPAFVYNMVNQRRNVGVTILESAELLYERGCPDEKYMPYRADDYVYRPGTGAVQDAGRHTIRGFGRVDFTDLDQVKAHLLQGSVVVVNMRISENFVTHKGPIWARPSGAVAGLQTVAVVGYDERSGVFTIQNSVGGAWGQYGRTNVPYVWFLRLVRTAYVIW